MRKVLGCVLCVWVLACGAAFAADAKLKAAAKEIVAKNAAAVVPLKIVTSLKITYQGREMPAREQESEALGTVLDETGLIVASNTATNPAASRANANPAVKIESELKSAKLVSTAKGGTDITLKIVFRDKDLDLVFLRPEEKASLPHLGVKAGPTLELLDDVVVLARLGGVGDRQPSVTLGTVQAVVQKPRRLYVIGLVDSMTALGCPVFDVEGGLVGIVVIRVGQGAAQGSALGGLGSKMLPTILPIADILEDMGQIEKPE